MSISLALPYRIRWGLTAAASTAMLAVLVVLASLSATAPKSGAAVSNEATSGIASAPLVRLADKHPGRPVEAIVQFPHAASLGWSELGFRHGRLLEVEGRRLRKR